MRGVAERRVRSITPCRPQVEQPPAFSSSPSTDQLPDYIRRDLTQPRLPRYTRHDGRTATIEELLPTEEERLASLQAFAEEKSYANDYFGGQKGAPEGPPNDPFKIFRWAKRKMSGEKGAMWRRLSVEQMAKWEGNGGPVDASKGEVARGDVDTSRIV